MEQGNTGLPNQNNVSKWIVAILLIIFIPPLGAYYIWKEKQVFSKKIHLLILFFGVWTLVSSLILLTIWLPTLKNSLQGLGLNIPTYPSIALTFIIFLSIVQIIFAFIIDKKQTSSQPLPKNYLIVALIFLTINLILVPLVFITVKWAVSQQLYKMLLF